ncbi:N-acetyltransferase [Escherichia coli]|nr:N-acetyltransferase [Escherichia coli]
MTSFTSSIRFSLHAYVAKVVEKMRREKRKIIPLCPFAKHEFDKTREYDDIRS